MTSINSTLLNKLYTFAFQLEASPPVINGRGALSSGFTCRRRRRLLSARCLLSSPFWRRALELSGREQRGSNVRCGMKYAQPPRRRRRGAHTISTGIAGCVFAMHRCRQGLRISARVRKLPMSTDTKKSLLTWFGELCFCCCLPPLTQLACCIPPTA